MAKSTIYAGLEIGTHKICVVVGEAKRDGAIGREIERQVTGLLFELVDFQALVARHRSEMHLRGAR